LQKYHNENTPASSIPSYLEELEKNVNNITKDHDTKNQPPKENVK